MSTNRCLLFASLVLITSLGLAARASAQLCLGGDGLQGPCCTSVSITFPFNFPGFSMPTAGLCWTGCSATQVVTSVTVDPPAQVQCGFFTTKVTVYDSSGVPLLTGPLLMDYTRTWREVSDDGDDLQVWRFVVRGDLASTGVPGCPVPPGEPQSFFYGHLDYAFNCFQGHVEQSLSLFHSCDPIVHNNVASAFPGAYHPGLSFGIVGPDTAANPFVPVNQPPLQGYVQGAVRNTFTSSGQCTAEELVPLVPGNNMFTLGQACASPFSTSGPPQYYAQQLKANGLSCGSGFNSILTSLPLVWPHTVTVSLGHWTGSGPGTPYPGDEDLWVCEGFYLYQDGCSSKASIDFDYGVQTADGFSVIAEPLRPWQTPFMLDLASNFSKTSGFLPPFTGFASPAHHIIAVNF
ncbi:MAG: hypothetical protein RL885_18250 [Planctomycetota bacterium]